MLNKVLSFILETFFGHKNMYNIWYSKHVLWIGLSKHFLKQSDPPPQPPPPGQ